MALNDYLDAYAAEELTGFGGRRARELGTVPFVPVFVAPGSPGFIANLVDRVAVDNAMWALDSRWRASGTWTSMKTCVRPQNVQAPGSPAVIIATPWAQLGPDGCRNATNSVTQPTCNWGFWRINKCDLETASTLSFQYGRYLWAQARMRDLLASRPQPGVTSAQVAADWTWNAAQLISALWWSTNVRFDNPNAAYTAGSYLTNLRAAGLVYPAQNLDAVIYGGPAYPSQSISNLGIPYDGAPTGKNITFIPYALAPRMLNMVGNTPTAPTGRNDFNPGAGPLPWMDRRAPGPLHPLFAQAAGQVPYTLPIPIGMSTEQADDVRAAAFAVYQAAGDSDGLRWASTKAFNDFWFRATWSWGTRWRALGDFYTRTSYTPSGPGGGSATYGWSSSPSTVAIGGALMAVDDMAKQLAFYSAPSKTFIAWMQSGMQTYNADTSGINAGQGQAAIDFVNAKFNLMTQISSAAQAEVAASSAPQGAAATYTGLAVSVVQTVMGLVGGVAALFSTIYTIVTTLVTQLIVAGLGAQGNTACPAFPFIRVMAPTNGRCDLSTDQITASILGIDSRAFWPVIIGGQTRTFVVDSKTFTANFTATDTTADLVARRINGAAALVGLGPVASVRGGQVHVEGTDATTSARATAGTAAALNFPGPLTTGGYTWVDHSVPVTAMPAAKAKSSSIPWLVGGAVLLRLLLR